METTEIKKIKRAAKRSIKKEKWSCEVNWKALIRRDWLAKNTWKDRMTKTIADMRVKDKARFLMNRLSFFMNTRDKAAAKRHKVTPVVNKINWI